MNKKKIVFNRLFWAGTALLISVFFAATAQASHLGNPHRSLLKSASELDYPPFALVRPDGSADGFSVDLLKAVTGAVRLKVDLTVGPWHELKQELAEGRLDVLPLVAYSPEREKVYDFTAPYFRMHGEIFVRRGEERIHSIADLRNKKIMVMRDDTAHEYLVRQQLAGNLILTDSFEEALTMLSAGQHDAVVAQELVGLQLIKKLDLTNIVGVHSSQETRLVHSSQNLLPGFEQKFSMAVRKGDAELLAHLNEGLALVIADGTFSKLQEKWFAPIFPAPPIPTALLIKYTIYILGPFLLLLALANAWFLRREVARKTRDLRREIAKQNQTEKLLQENEGRFRELFDNMSSGVAVYEVVNDGEDFLFKDMNRTGLKLSPVRRSELLGNSVQKFFPGIKELGLLDVFRRVWRTGVPEFFPCGKYQDDEWSYWVENHVYKLPSGEIVAIYDDVTERKKAEAELARSQDEWKKTFDAMSDIITIQDKDMKVLRANKAARDFFGVKPGGLNGKHCYEIFRGEDQPCAQCPELKTLADCSAHSGIIKHEKLGKTFSVSSAPIFEENGDIKYIVHVAKDITEQKKLEEELFQSHKMEAIGTLAGGIAHDFNNILSAVIGYSELTLIELPENSPSRDNVDQVLKAGNRARELVKQILSFSRKNNRNLEPFAPSTIIKEALKLMRASLPTTIAIKTEIDQNCGGIVADPTNLHQILVNLCTNALHAIENEKGEIRIKLTQQQLTSEDTAGQISVEPGLFVVLTVTDTGCGMDDATVKRIFEPYFTTKDLGKGTGMGLSVVHGIMQGYHGMIKVASEPGKGTTFKLYFPAIESAVASNGEDKAGFLKSLPRGNERILVVDDEESIVKMEQVFLESLGYKVTSKNSSVEALDEFRKEPGKFDLLITDQTMPVMTGVDLSREIRELKPDFPIILCTGFSPRVTAEAAKEVGIKKFAVKPVDVKQMATMVRQIFDEK